MDFTLVPHTVELLYIGEQGNNVPYVMISNDFIVPFSCLFSNIGLIDAGVYINKIFQYSALVDIFENCRVFKYLNNLNI